jgi:MoaA/NifB/PqqE/SkfB family radical SAM enzyme
LKFLKQLHTIDINGNFGDIVMNPESLEIVEYFRQSNENLLVKVCTNGSARNTEFWQRMATLDTKVYFAIDGLEDTHHLYRQNTSWKTILKNAKEFIQAGGYAVWKMIKFDHNQHQIQQCEQLSQQLGFKSFILINSDRTVAPVFNKQGTLTHCLGDYRGEKDFQVLFRKKTTDEVLLEDIIPGRSPSTIQCQVKNSKSLYICANGEVYPCCFLGLYPRTYGAGQYHQAANAQVSNLVKENNALRFSLEHCINWFKSVERSWNVPTFEQGRLVICNDNCGLSR